MTEVRTALVTVTGWTGECRHQGSPFSLSLSLSCSHSLSATHTHTHTHQRFLKVCGTLSRKWASRAWHTWSAVSGTGGCVQSVFRVYAHTCMRQCLHMTELLRLPESKPFAFAKDPKIERKKESSQLFWCFFPPFCHAVFCFCFNGIHLILKHLLSLIVHGAPVSVSSSQSWHRKSVSLLMVQILT